MRLEYGDGRRARLHRRPSSIRRCPTPPAWMSSALLHTLIATTDEVDYTEMLDWFGLRFAEPAIPRRPGRSKCGPTRRRPERALRRVHGVVQEVRDQRAASMRTPNCTPDRDPGLVGDAALSLSKPPLPPSALGPRGRRVGRGALGGRGGRVQGRARRGSVEPAGRRAPRLVLHHAQAVPGGRRGAQGRDPVEAVRQRGAGKPRLGLQRDRPVRATRFHRCQEAIRLDSKDARAFSDLAYAYRHLSLFDEAVAAYTKAAAAAPADPRPLREIGNVATTRI